MLRTATALLTTCLLCACGQRGNLTLPDAPADEVRSAATAPTAAATDNATADERERERANAARNRNNR